MRGQRVSSPSDEVCLGTGTGTAGTAGLDEAGPVDTALGADTAGVVETAVSGGYDSADGPAAGASSASIGAGTACDFSTLSADGKPAVRRQATMVS